MRAVAPILILAAVLLAGCSTAIAGTPSAADSCRGSACGLTTTPRPEGPDLDTTARVEPGTSSLIDQAYLRVLAGRGIDGGLPFGRATFICSYLDAGQSWAETLVAVEESNGFTSGQAGYQIGAAVAAYCPDHRSELPSS